MSATGDEESIILKSLLNCCRCGRKGDTSFWSILEELAQGAIPAVEIDGPGPLRRQIPEPLEDISRWTVRPTENCARLLEEDIERVQANGIDCWLGGVHLCGKESQWRWDERRCRLVNMLP